MFTQPSVVNVNNLPRARPFNNNDFVSLNQVEYNNTPNWDDVKEKIKTDMQPKTSFLLRRNNQPFMGEVYSTVNEATSFNDVVDRLKSLPGGPNSDDPNTNNPLKEIGFSVSVSFVAKTNGGLSSNARNRRVVKLTVAGSQFAFYLVDQRKPSSLLSGSSPKLYVYQIIDDTAIPQGRVTDPDIYQQLVNILGDTVINKIFGTSSTDESFVNENPELLNPELSGKISVYGLRDYYFIELNSTNNPGLFGGSFGQPPKYYLYANPGFIPGAPAAAPAPATTDPNANLDPALTDNGRGADTGGITPTSAALGALAYMLNKNPLPSNPSGGNRRKSKRTRNKRKMRKTKQRKAKQGKTRQKRKQGKSRRKSLKQRR